MPIGVCNVSVEQLEDLLVDERDRTVDTDNNERKVSDDNSCSTETNALRVQYVQNEYHPFLRTKVPDVCRKHGIQFESHSTLWGNLEDYESVLRKLLEGKEKNTLSQNMAQLAIAFAANAFTDVDKPLPVEVLPSICFTTTNYTHLRDICRTRNISCQLLALMREMCHQKQVVRYKGASSGINTDWIQSCDTEFIRWKIIPTLMEDFNLFVNGKIPSELCVQIPKRYQKREVHGTIAEMLYAHYLNNKHEAGEESAAEVDDALEQLFGRRKTGQPNLNGDLVFNDLDKDFANQRLSGLLKKMRHCVENARKDLRMQNKVAMCPIKAVTNPEALPMDYFPDSHEFDDLHQYIIEMTAVRKKQAKNAEDTVVPGYFKNIKFKYGSLNCDENKGHQRRVDTKESSNIRFKHGTLNSDGRLDLCKQGVKNAYVESCTAVIADGNSQENANIRFKHGTLNSDGRLDLCKQGVKNAYVESCDAVSADNQSECLIKHYLIGNNVIGDNSDGEAETRVNALCHMIRRRPDITTWYLAGNALNETFIEQVAGALINSHAKYIWFKMNPVKTGCSALAKLIQCNPNIELLDMFNCGVEDFGLTSFCTALVQADMQLPGSADGEDHSVDEIAALLSELLTPSEQADQQNDLCTRCRALNRSNLKHLYLAINNITEKGIGALFCILAVLSETLESVYINANPIGDSGWKTFRGKMIASGVTFPNLKRVSIGSCGLTDASLESLQEFVRSSPNLVSMELSSYKSTNYFALDHNKFTDLMGLYDLASLLKENAVACGDPDRSFIGFQHALSEIDPQCVTALVEEIFDKLGVNVNGLQRKNNEGIQGGKLIHDKLTKRQLAEITDPHPALDYIQSIYRNTMKL